MWLIWYIARNTLAINEWLLSINGKYFVEKVYYWVMMNDSKKIYMSGLIIMLHT